MRLIYHPDAEEEFLEAVRFYRDRAPGLGERFAREFDKAIATIVANPDRWRVIEGNVRRFLMRTFPYGILYRIEGDDLRILVVKHHSRHPDYWKYRLGP